MSQLLQLIHNHLNEQGYNAHIVLSTSPPKLTIVSITSIKPINHINHTEITETQDTINCRIYQDTTQDTINCRIYLHTTQINKNDPELLTKITQWYKQLDN